MSGSAGGTREGGPGFGLTIVELLGRQLQATIRRDPTETGVRTTVVLPLVSVGGGR